MIESKEFSTVTKNYLSRYYEILDEMKQGMCEPALTESISHNFIVQMIPHHQAAIEMSNNLLQYTTFVPLQNIAAHIIASQTKSIADMRAALAQCSELPNTEQELCLYARRFEQITQTMFTDMGNATATNHLNCNFIDVYKRQIIRSTPRPETPRNTSQSSSSRARQSWNICPVSSTSSPAPSLSGMWPRSAPS